MKFLISQQGVAIYLALIIVFILLGIGLGLSTILIGQIKMIRGIGYSVPAFYAADSGAERALYGVLKNNDKTSKNGTLDNGSLYNFSLCHGKIQSTGSYRNVKRAIETTYPFEGLYIGTGNNGYIYVYEEGSGCQFDTSYSISEEMVRSFAVYNNKLYTGTGSNGIIYVYDGSTWDVAYPTLQVWVRSLAVYNNKLYAGTGNNGIIYVYDGSTWEVAYPTLQTAVISPAVYNNKLYAETTHNGINYVYDGST